MTDPTTTPLPFHAVDVAPLSLESDVAVEGMSPSCAARHAVRQYRERLLANNPDLVLAGPEVVYTPNTIKPDTLHIIDVGGLSPSARHAVREYTNRLRLTNPNVALEDNEPEIPPATPATPARPTWSLRTITLFQNPVPPGHTHKADWTILEDGVMMDRLDAMEMMWALQHSLIAGTTPPRWPQGSIDGIIERSRREGERNVRNNIQQEYYEAMAGSGQNEAAPNFEFKTAPIAMPELHFGNNGKLRAVRLKDGVLTPIKAPTPPRKPRTAAALIDSMVAPRPRRKGTSTVLVAKRKGESKASTARRARTPAKFKKTPAKKPTKR